MKNFKMHIKIINRKILNDEYKSLCIACSLFRLSLQNKQTNMAVQKNKVFYKNPTHNSPAEKTTNLLFL